MPAPYPQYVYDFTAARGVAMHLDASLAKALVEHLDGQVSGNNDLANDIVKEVESMYSYMLSQPGLPDVTLSEAVGKFKPHAARGLVAALTRDTPELSPKASALLQTVSKVHGISSLAANEMRDALLVCSVAYTLPRMTASVSTVSDHVIATWGELSPDTQQEIRSLISEAIRTGRTGADVDKRGWIAVLDNAEALDTAAQPSF
ncbi:hypothetical protein [Rhizobium sp. MHM7A]|uniref:hypothetical protein n=1 Tax=Rhizobium sp. MHM7A TaxID=2583233 RepID=UPI0011072123|nr:hypothetical protein [Rhizobium sp. MHM7A]TLX16337.1 hypothetical protein FFR93_03125 [Rhizobium sp. MHM7A]